MDKEKTEIIQEPYDPKRAPRMKAKERIHNGKSGMTERQYAVRFENAKKACAVRLANLQKAREANEAKKKKHRKSDTSESEQSDSESESSAEEFVIKNKGKKSKRKGGGGDTDKLKSEIETLKQLIMQSNKQAGPVVVYPPSRERHEKSEPKEAPHYDSNIELLRRSIMN